MTATRTMTKQQWRRERYAAAGDAETRMTAAYDWLRATVTELPNRRDPDPAVRDRNAALARAVTADAVTWLCARAAEMDSVADMDLRQAAFSASLQKLVRQQSEDRERIRRASEWFRWSAKQLWRRSRRYTVTAEGRQTALALREQMIADAADYLGSLAERAGDA
jgi:hypothetical protein